MRGVQNLEGGWPKMAIFARGGSLPLGHLSVTSNRDSSLATQRSVHSAIHERAVTCWDSVRSPGADDSKSDPTLANPAWENQKRPSARRVSPARVVQIQRTTPHPNSALPRSSHFGLVPRGAPGGTFVTYNCRTFAEGAAPLSKTSLIT